MNNVTYGKTMENLRNRINAKLANNEKFYLRCTSKPSYMSYKIFGNNLVAIRRRKVALKLNRPVYIGMCISEYSKVLIYEFHHDYIKKILTAKQKILFTKSDSVTYEIKTEELYEDFRNNMEMCDFSNYSTKSKYYDNSNKLGSGKMKEKTGGDAIEYWLG